MSAQLVTVVDAASVFEQLGTMDSLVDRGWNDVKGDPRTVSHLLCDQLEFADLLLVNKRDLVSEAELGAVEAFLRKVNPAAEVVRTEHSVLEPAALLGTARFDMRKAAAHPQWLKEAREHEHTPETLEYGISSFVFRAKRPFHPGRLHAALAGRPRPGALGGLLRLKGFAWLATQRSRQAHAALAGTTFTVRPGPPWWAAIPREQWPDGLAEELERDTAEEGVGVGAVKPTGALSAALVPPLKPGKVADLEASNAQEEHGDRRTELVCIGRELDDEAARAQLEACLLTDDEMAGGEPSWAALADPFAKPKEGAEGNGIVEGVRGGSSVITVANLRKFIAMESQGAQVGSHDDILNFMFECLGEEGRINGDPGHAVKQIQTCDPALREMYAASADPLRTQLVVLKGVSTLVMMNGGALLKQTPALLTALHDIGLISTEMVLKWHAHAHAPVSPTGAKVRLAAVPFIQQLQDAEQVEGTGTEVD